MRVSVATRGPGERATDLLALPVTQLDPKSWRRPRSWAEIDSSVGGSLSAAISSGDFRGERGQTQLLYGSGRGASRRVLLCGLGPEAEAAAALREAAAAAVREAGSRSASRVEFQVPRERALRSPEALQAMAEGAVLGAYRYDRYQTAKKNGAVGRFDLLFGGSVPRQARSAVSAGVDLAESQNLARDLSNEPPCDLYPASLARKAQAMARKVGLRSRVLDVAALRKLQMGAMLAVAQGSSNTPRLIVLEHNAPTRGRTSRRPTVCLVGKGVTFDSGGLSLKPSASMVTMKHDMSGGAAVIGAMRACALLDLPLHVVGLVGAVENMPSGTAYRPDDVVTSASGQTVEIGNTDAEGRLVLADVLHYARTQYKPAAMVDVATLTGAAVIALGKWCAGVLSNRDSLARGIVEAGEATDERYWQLPLWDAHRKFMQSYIADVKQVGGREAGTITAAAFLSHFVGDTPWAHLDIAGTANTDIVSVLQPRGATGFGVRSLVSLLQGFRELDL